MAKPQRPTNIEDLIKRTKEGDIAAREELLAYAMTFLRWKAQFERATASRGKSDLGQDAMERALKGIATVPVSTGDKFDGWLSSILIHRVREIHRNETRDRRDRRQEVPIEDLDPEVTPNKQKSPSARMTTEEDYHELHNALSKLPPDQARAVRLKHIAELPVSEVAKRLKRTEIEVAGLLQRGVNGVRKHLMGKANVISRKTRDATIVALLEYLQKLDVGEQIDLKNFVAAHPKADASLLESFVECAQCIHEIGGNSRGENKRKI